MKEKRDLYFSYVEEFTAVPLKESAVADDAFEQIDKDVRRTLSDFGFFHKQSIPVGSRHPLHPQHPKSLYKCSRLLFTRLKNIHADFGSRTHSRPHLRSDTSDAISSSSHVNGSLPGDSSVKELGDIKKSSSISSLHGGHTEPPDDFTLGCDFHWEVIERILFIYSKLNPGVGYVQGMNEVVGPLYYTFATDSNADFKMFAEPDTFWVFFTLMSELKDLYMKSMDIDKVSGINASMTKLYSTLERVDVELFRNLESKSLHPAYFAFRWLSLLLAQEFDLPDLLRLWDSIFADKNRFQFLINISCSMILHVKQEILDGSFHDNMKLLQNYPLKNMNSIIARAYKLYDEEIVLIHSQITPSPSVVTSPKSPMEELAGFFSPAIQSLSSTINDFSSRMSKRSA